MIEYRIKDPAFFISSMGSIAKLADETVLQFGKMFRTYGLDTSHICLYELIIDEGELDIKKDGKIDVVVSISDLQKILNRFKSPDELYIIYDNNQITIKGKINNKSKTFRLSVLDIDPMDDPSETLSGLRLDSVFNIDSDDILEMVKDAEVYSDSFIIETNDDKLIIKAFANVGDIETEYNLESGTTSNERCSYPISFMKDILTGITTTELIIGFSKDMPIMIYNKLSKKSYIRWYIGPRVEQDE